MNKSEKSSHQMTRKKEMEYRICTRCVMDTSDLEIEFDENGECNHCRRYDDLMKKNVFTGEEGERMLSSIAGKVKENGKEHEYDCVLGLSGGCDSTYVAYLAKQLGLRPYWEERLRSHVVSSGQLHPSTGIDYFVFPRGLWGEIPPFAIGRAAWDNWMLYRARARRAALIDATQVVMAVHQNHDYAHVPGGAEEVGKGQEAQRNLALARGYDHTFRLSDANWLLTTQGLIRALTPEHHRRARETWLLLHCHHSYIFQKKFRKLLPSPRRLLMTLVRKVRRLFI